MEFAACQADGQRLRAQCESEKAAQNAAYTIQRQTCEAHRDQVVKCVAQALGVDAISASCIGCIEGAENARCFGLHLRMRNRHRKVAICGVPLNAFMPG